MSACPTPSGSLLERLSAVADLHTRNALLCSPGLTSQREVLQVANRHVLIHEQAAADIREAVALLSSAEPVAGRGPGMTPSIPKGQDQ